MLSQIDLTNVTRFRVVLYRDADEKLPTHPEDIFEIDASRTHTAAGKYTAYFQQLMNHCIAECMKGGKHIRVEGIE